MLNLNNCIIKYVIIFEQISRASNCTDYQSHQLGIRYRPDSTADNPKKGKGNVAPQFAHTLNATACAVPRMIVCLVENYQQEDGSVVVPEPLRPFMGGIQVTKPKKSKQYVEEKKCFVLCQESCSIILICLIIAMTFCLCKLC